MGEVGPQQPPPSSFAPLGAPTSSFAPLGAHSISWRDRRRSRIAEVSDGARMMFSDVAVVRTAAVVAAMWVVAALGRSRAGPWAFALAFAAALYLFAEMVNTLVEMLVDRISLQPHRFSARIKHAAAFLSFLTGAAAFLLLGIVAVKLFFGPSRTAALASLGGTQAALASLGPSPALASRGGTQAALASRGPSPALASRGGPLNSSHSTSAAAATQSQPHSHAIPHNYALSEPLLEPTSAAHRRNLLWHHRQNPQRSQTPLPGSGAQDRRHAAAPDGDARGGEAQGGGDAQGDARSGGDARGGGYAQGGGDARGGGDEQSGGTSVARAAGRRPLSGRWAEAIRSEGSGTWRSSILHPLLWEERVARRRRYRTARETPRTSQDATLL